MLKMWVILSMKHVNLSVQCVIMLNGCAVLSTQHVKRLCNYLKSWVSLSKKHVNWSV